MTNKESPPYKKVMDSFFKNNNKAIAHGETQDIKRTKIETTSNNDYYAGQNKVNANRFLKKSYEDKNAQTYSNSSKNGRNKTRFVIQLDGNIKVGPSNSAIAHFLSTQIGAAYILEKNEWIIRPEHIDPLMKILSSNKMPHDKIPAGVLKILKSTKNQMEFDLKGGIYDKLLGFQRDAVNFGLNNNGRVLLGDDMGLGKTIQALAIANYYSLEFPLLIISPASLTYNWKESIKQFLDM